MREIKFRAWDKNTKIMIHWDYLVKSRISFRNFRWALLSENSENFELMQYTGIKDANGIEVYEGDVLKDHNEYWEVRFFDGAFWVASIRGNAESELLCGNDYMEIIGNRYENPELLKEEPTC